MRRAILASPVVSLGVLASGVVAGETIGVSGAGAAEHSIAATKHASKATFCSTNDSIDRASANTTSYAGFLAILKTHTHDLTLLKENAPSGSVGRTALQLVSGAEAAIAANDVNDLNSLPNGANVDTYCGTWESLAEVLRDRKVHCILLGLPPDLPGRVQFFERFGRPHRAHGSCTADFHTGHRTVEVAEVDQIQGHNHGRPGSNGAQKRTVRRQSSRAAPAVRRMTSPSIAAKTNSAKRSTVFRPIRSRPVSIASTIRPIIQSITEWSLDQVLRVSESRSHSRESPRLPACIKASNTAACRIGRHSGMPAPTRRASTAPPVPCRAVQSWLDA